MASVGIDGSPSLFGTSKEMLCHVRNTCVFEASSDLFKVLLTVLTSIGYSFKAWSLASFAEVFRSSYVMTGSSKSSDYCWALSNILI
jgi:hypothetical protein